MNHNDDRYAGELSCCPLAKSCLMTYNAELRREYAGYSVFLSSQLEIQHLGPSSPPPPTPPSSAKPRSAFKKPSPQIIPAQLPRMLSVSELRQRRIEAAKHKSSDESDTAAEPDGQARLRAERQLLEREFEEQEMLRHLALEADLRHAARVRKEKEEREAREEAERRSAIESRRNADRERRQRQAQELQEWMEKKNREEEEEARRRNEARRLMAKERRNRPLPVAPSSRSSTVLDINFNDWVTAQSTDSLAWKRRYCRVKGAYITLSKDVVSCNHYLTGASHLTMSSGIISGFSNCSHIIN